MSKALLWLGPTGLLTLALGGYYIAWPQMQLYWQKDRRAYCEAQLKDYELKAKAANEAIVVERNALKVKLDKAEDDHETRMAAIIDRNVNLTDRLSVALQNRCAGLPETTAPGQGDDGGTGGDGLWAGSGERLARVAGIADEQAERLVWCQDYVRQVTKQ